MPLDVKNPDVQKQLAEFLGTIADEQERAHALLFLTMAASEIDDAKEAIDLAKQALAENANLPPE